MRSFKTIEIERVENVATIWLNRPEVKNAFNDIMVLELTEAFGSISKDSLIKVVVLRGRGDVFCSGADLNWMRSVSEMDYEQNYADSLALAKCMYTLYSIPQPVVAVAQGAVKGGGNGLLAASDIALCLNTTKFSFSEVTLGLVPAVISPYVINKIGISRAKELMLTARVFDGKEAAAYNLVNASVDEQELPDLLNKYIGWLSANSKQAMQATKELLKKLPSLGQRDVLLDITAKTIAQARISPDGQEGMSAFLEKRKPNFKK